MFYTANTIAKTEGFVIQQRERIIFFSHWDERKVAHWTSDKGKAHRFKTIVDAVQEARNLNLSNVLIIRDLFQVIEVEIEHNVVEDEPLPVV
jgi:hypothetical protein